MKRSFRLLLGIWVATALLLLPEPAEAWDPVPCDPLNQGVCYDECIIIFPDEPCQDIVLFGCKLVSPTAGGTIDNSCGN